MNPGSILSMPVGRTIVEFDFHSPCMYKIYVEIKIRWSVVVSTIGVSVGDDLKALSATSAHDYILVLEVLERDKAVTVIICL